MPFAWVDFINHYSAIAFPDPPNQPKQESLHENETRVQGNCTDVSPPQQLNPNAESIWAIRNNILLAIQRVTSCVYVQPGYTSLPWLTCVGASVPHLTPRLCACFCLLPGLWRRHRLHLRHPHRSHLRRGRRCRRLLPPLPTKKTTKKMTEWRSAPTRPVAAAFAPRPGGRAPPVSAS